MNSNPNNIPYFIKKYIKDQKDKGYGLEATFYQIHSDYKQLDGSEWSREVEWITSNDELFARAWILIDCLQM